MPPDVALGTKVTCAPFMVIELATRPAEEDVPALKSENGAVFEPVATWALMLTGLAWTAVVPRIAERAAKTVREMRRVMLFQVSVGHEAGCGCGYQSQVSCHSGKHLYFI